MKVNFKNLAKFCNATEQINLIRNGHTDVWVSLSKLTEFFDMEFIKKKKERKSK